MKPTIVDYTAEKIRIKGNTTPFDAALESLGTGERKDKGWIFPSSQKQAVQGIIGKEKKSVITEVREKQAALPTKEKEAWETDEYLQVTKEQAEKLRQMALKVKYVKSVDWLDKGYYVVNSKKTDYSSNTLGLFTKQEFLMTIFDGIRKGSRYYSMIADIMGMNDIISKLSAEYKDKSKSDIQKQIKDLEREIDVYRNKLEKGRNGNNTPTHQKNMSIWANRWSSDISNLRLLKGEYMRRFVPAYEVSWRDYHWNYYEGDDKNESKKMHMAEVQKALSEGKPVPSEVLAEYPDLASPAAAAKEGKESNIHTEYVFSKDEMSRIIPVLNDTVYDIMNNIPRYNAIIEIGYDKSNNSIYFSNKITGVEYAVITKDGRLFKRTDITRGSLVDKTISEYISFIKNFLHDEDIYKEFSWDSEKFQKISILDLKTDYFKKLYTEYYTKNPYGYIYNPFHYMKYNEFYDLDRILNRNVYRMFTIPSQIDDSIKEKHKFFIEKALSEGKPVPPEVLAEYPDLASPAAAEAEGKERSVPIYPEYVAYNGQVWALRYDRSQEFYFLLKENLTKSASGKHIEKRQMLGYLKSGKAEVAHLLSKKGNPILDTIKYNVYLEMDSEPQYIVDATISPAPAEGVEKEEYNHYAAQKKGQNKGIDYLKESGDLFKRISKVYGVEYVDYTEASNHDKKMVTAYSFVFFKQKDAERFENSIKKYIPANVLDDVHIFSDSIRIAVAQDMNHVFFSALQQMVDDAERHLKLAQARATRLHTRQNQNNH